MREHRLFLFVDEYGKHAKDPCLLSALQEFPTIHRAMQANLRSKRGRPKSVQMPQKDRQRKGHRTARVASR